MISIDRISQNMCGYGTVELTIRANERDLFDLDGIGEVTANRLVNLALGGYKPKAPKVKDVMFHDQATILFWDDGEKTVVKCRECEKCIYDKDYDEYIDGLGPIVISEDVEIPKEIVRAAQRTFCYAHFDSEKAVMAAMLKRLYKNYQDVLREALEGDDE